MYRYFLLFVVLLLSACGVSEPPVVVEEPCFCAMYVGNPCIDQCFPDEGVATQYQINIQVDE